MTSASACSTEHGDVRYARERLEHRAPVRERDLPEAAGRALVEQERVVGCVLARRRRVELGAPEQVLGQELQRQRAVHVDRALELGQPVDDGLGELEVAVALEPLGRDHLGQQPNDALALHRHLHLGDRRVEQVPAILAARAADVVDRSRRVQLGREQARVRLGEDPPHLAELGHALAEQDPVLGLGDRLVEAVLGHPDRAEAEVELADVDRVQGRLEGCRTGVEHVLLPVTGYSSRSNALTYSCPWTTFLMSL